MELSRESDALSPGNPEYLDHSSMKSEEERTRQIAGKKYNDMYFVWEILPVKSIAAQLPEQGMLWWQ